MPVLGLLGTPVYIFIAANLMVRKAGRLAALCDFFMPDGA
jgi:hypothetical protein